MVAGVKGAGKSERLVLPQSSAGALCLSVESASTGPCSPPRPPEEAVPCFAITVMIPRLQAHARDMACLRAAFNVFFYPQRLVTQELQRGMRATALVSVSFLFSCPDAVELELVRVRGHGPFRLTHRSLGVITYKKKEGCPDDKRDEDQTKEMNISSQQVSISRLESSKGRLPQTFISAQDSKGGTEPEHEDLLLSLQGKPKPKQTTNHIRSTKNCDQKT